MRTLRIIGLITSVVVVNAMLLCPVYAADPILTDWGTVTTLQAGWTIDRMLVFHSAPMKNPDNCSLTTNGYIIDESAPGHKTFYALLLGALLNGKETALVISGCFENRPQIISVAIRP
jgi:hypothetical protein